MRAAVFRAYGGPEVLRWEEIDDPVVGPHDVLVDVRACGVNHCDLDSRSGASRWPYDFPGVLGSEPAGVVAGLGEQVEGLKAGDPVAVLQHFDDHEGHLVQCGIDRWGGYAELIAVPAHAVIRLDSVEQIPLAAASQTVAATAWRMVTTLADIRQDEVVLVPSASGGVASLLVGAAKLRGARVIATVGTSHKLDAVRGLGADSVFCYRDTSIVETVQSQTGGRGVDCVLDTVGGPMFQDHLAALRDGGRLVSCGAHAGEVVELDMVRLFQRGQRIIGFGFASESEIREALGHVLAGRLTVPIAATFPMSRAADAHEAMDLRAHVGKLLLERDPSTAAASQT